MTIHKHRGLCSFDSRVGVGHTLGCALPRQVSPGLLAGNEAQGDQIAGVVDLPRLASTGNDVPTCRTGQCATSTTQEGESTTKVTPKPSISPPSAPQPDYRLQQLPPPRLQGEGCANVGCTRWTQALGPNRAQWRETLRQQRPVRRDASLSTRRRATVVTARDILARMLLAPPPLARRRRVAMWRRRWR